MVASVEEVQRRAAELFGVVELENTSMVRGTKDLIF